MGIALSVWISLIGCVIVGIAVMGFIITQYVRVRTGKSRWYLLFPVFIWLGGFLLESEERLMNQAQGQAETCFLEDVTFLEGTVVWVDLGTETKKTQVRLGELQYKGETLPGALLVYLDGYQGAELEIGWRIQVWGQAENMEPERNPGGFDARSYYAAGGVYYRMYGEGYQVRKRESHKEKTVLLQLRRCWKAQLETLTSPEHAAVFSAMLLGDQRLLEEELKERYQLAGIAHVLAISGLHLSILGMGLFRILRKCGSSFWVSGVISAAVMGAFTYLTGASTSCLRAYIMFFMMLFANATGRTYDTPSALSLAGLLLLLEQPLRLFQSGFLLSFGAIVAIAGIAPILQGFVAGNKERPGKLLGTLMTSLAVQFLTLPICAWFFYRISPWGPVLNLVVIPLMSVLMGSMLLSLVLSYTPLKQWTPLTILPAEEILDCYDLLCNGVTKIPGGQLVTGRPRVGQIVVYGVVLTLVLTLCQWWRKKHPSPAQVLGKQKEKGGEKETTGLSKKRTTWGHGACILLLSVTLPLFLARQRLDCVEVVMLDVGQGDSMLLLMPEGRTILLDGGSSSTKEVYEKILQPALQYYGVEWVDMWFLSHPDTDHISGFTEYLADTKGISLDTLVLSGCQNKEAIWKNTISTYSGKVQYLSRGQVIRFPDTGMTIQCLSPGIEEIGEDVNDLSLVLHLQWGESSMLFCGDISTKQEETILGHLDEGKIFVTDVLKVAHHGSKYSSGEAFLKAVQAKQALISVGRNLYGHPTPETLQRLEKSGALVYQTIKHGAIMVYLREDREPEISTYITAPEQEN